MPDWCYGIITIDQNRQDNKQRVGKEVRKQHYMRIISPTQNWYRYRTTNEQGK